MGGLLWATLGLLGCGGSSSTSTTSAHAAAAKAAPVCEPAAAAVIARAVGVDAVRAKVTTGNNASPECHYVGTGRRRVVVVVNVDSAPQPYERLERTIVEDGQQFGTQRGFTPPQTVNKLGLDAAWLPDQSKLMTTDGARLITVTVRWRGAAPKRQLALAEAAARTYLGPLQPKAAEPNGTG